MNGEEVISVGKKWLDTTNNVVRYDHIKSMVTKEMYSSVEYRVETN